VRVEKTPAIYACLDVSGSFDPHGLTAMLGADARITRAGEVRRNGAVREFDSWHFSTPKVASVDWPAQLDQVLELVRPRLDEFLTFCRVRALGVEVHLVAEMSGETPIGSFTTDQIAYLALLGCSLDIDLYEKRGEHE